MVYTIKPIKTGCNLGCTYCLTGDTLVLMSDLSWKKIKDVQVGDEVVGFDEYELDGARRYRSAVVTNVMSKIDGAYKVITDKGEVTASADHPWLTNDSGWLRTDQIGPGDRIYYVSPSNDEDIIGRVLSETAVVLDIEYVGIDRLFDLTTTTATFVANGLASHNCFEANTREAGFSAKYDIEAIQETMREVARNSRSPQFTLHGGEPTLLPKKDFEAILRASYELTGWSGIQTNGWLLDDDHKKMFEKYNTHVGISLDGPWPLNRLRWAGSEEKTRDYTNKVIGDIKELLASGINTGVIIVLHTVNGSKDAVPYMKDFIEDLHEHGLRGGRLNPGFFDTSPQKEMFELSEDELIYFYENMWDTVAKEGYNWNPYVDVKNLLLSQFEEDRLKRGELLSGVTCAWLGCDVHHTRGEHVIYGDGSDGNCARLLGDGSIPLRSPVISNEREIVLSQIPWYAGGCKGCPFFWGCKGQCPAEGIDGDWRNRSRFCEAWYFLFYEWQRRLYENEIIPEKITDISSPSEIDMEFISGEGALGDSRSTGSSTSGDRKDSKCCGEAKIGGYPSGRKCRCDDH